MNVPKESPAAALLISEAYKLQNRQLHESNPHYGTSGGRPAGLVRQQMQKLATRDVLDYGCGKRKLEEALGIPIANYDPCIPGLDQRPEPHDIVVCSDVLEHIEPECLDAVLDDLQRVTRKAGLFSVCTVPAMKQLPDGRNAHLIVQGQDWWLPRFRERFVVEGILVQESDFVVLVRPLR